uniref:M polyprotein n=1 Tax=Elaeophora elaphi TaxID=1147741 RepID=A0A0R3RLF6_9BILA
LLQIFGKYDKICSSHRYGSQPLSKNKFISDGQCIVRYKNTDYEVHCCCYWRFRQDCTIPLDDKRHICANRTNVAVIDTEEIIEATLQSLPLGSSCFTIFQLNITDKETMHLISTSYGAPENNIHLCHRYILEDYFTKCSASESCEKMCPLLTPFPANLSHTLTVTGSDFGQNAFINNDNNYHLTNCAYRHILQYIFSPEIYANNCIIFYDFSLSKPLNLIYGYNMEFERSVEEIYGSKEELVMADIFQHRNLQNTWTKCCSEINASKEQIERITKGVKAWTVGVIKCDGRIEPRCDANLIEKIDKNRDYYRDKYGKLCYLKDFHEQKAIRGRSLITTWCYEETFGQGLDFINRRGFMLEDKKLPLGKICAHRLKTKIRYSNNTMFAYCFMMKQNNEEISTTCCCSSTVDKPCNFISEKYYIEKTNVYYTKKTLQTRKYCLSPNGERDLCLLGENHRVICYYTADMKNRKVEGGCVHSLTRKFKRHKLANV